MKHFPRGRWISAKLQESEGWVDQLNTCVFLFPFVLSVCLFFLFQSDSVPVSIEPIQITTDVVSLACFKPVIPTPPSTPTLNGKTQTDVIYGETCFFRSSPWLLEIFFPVSLDHAMHEMRGLLLVLTKAKIL